MNPNELLKAEKLKSLPFFSGLETEHVNQITAISLIRNYRKGEIIFLEGNEYKGFFIVVKGTVKVYKISPQRKELIIHLVKPLNTFADVQLFEGKIYPVNAQAEEDCTLLFVPQQEFLKLLNDNSAICIKMLAGFALRMRELAARVEELSLKEVNSRLAAYLIEEIERAGNTKLPELSIRLTLSKKTIASYLGTITETLSRSLNKLQKENIIRVAGKKIFILDYARLRQLSK